MSVGPVGKKPKSVPSISITSSKSTSSTSGVEKTKTGGTERKPPKGQQDTTGKAKMDSSVDTNDQLSKVSTGSKMERAKKGTGGTRLTKRTGTGKSTGKQGVRTGTDGSRVRGNKTGSTTNKSKTRTETGQKPLTSKRGGPKKYRTGGSKSRETTGGKTSKAPTGREKLLKGGHHRLKPSGPSPEPKNIRSRNLGGRKVQDNLSQDLKGIKESRQEQRTSEGPLTKKEQIEKLRSREGKTGGDYTELNQDGSLEMKRLHKTYREGEKDQPGRKVELDGKQIEVRDKKHQEGTGSTHYMNKKEREKSELGFYEKKPGEDTKTYNKVDGVEGMGTTPSGKSIFVMDGEGKVYTGKPAKLGEVDGKDVYTHHSTFLGGKSVAGAGGLTFRQDGTIGKIDDGSGHYRPGAKQNLQVMSELEKKGVQMDNVQFEKVSGRHLGKEQRTTGMVNEYREGKGSESTFRARHEVTNELTQKMERVRTELDKQGDLRGEVVKKKMEEEKARELEKQKEKELAKPKPESQPKPSTQPKQTQSQSTPPSGYEGIGQSKQELKPDPPSGYEGIKPQPKQELKPQPPSGYEGIKPQPKQELKPEPPSGYEGIKPQPKQELKPQPPSGYEGIKTPPK